MSSIVHLLELEQIEQDIFRGISQDLNTGQVFGGQVLSQAILAAQYTVEERELHSVHAYFLLRGDVNAPIVYQVDRSRDGKSFASRRVVAIQHGKPIFTLSASFQRAEEGMDYEPSFELPPIPPPLSEDNPTLQARKEGPARNMDLRSVPGEQLPDPHCLQWWMRTEVLADASAAVHRAGFAYMSDMGLIGSMLLPHGYNLGKDHERRRREVIRASIDHAIWYHRPLRADDWLLYECRPLSTSGGRGLATGRAFNTAGELVATTVQEGLMRRRN